MKTFDQLTDDQFNALCRDHATRIQLLVNALEAGRVVSEALQQEANRRVRAYRSVPAAVTTLLTKIGEANK